MADKNTDLLLATIIEAIEDVKGTDITMIDLRVLEQSVCDYFIVCSGNTNTQVSAIDNSIEKNVRRKLKEKPWHTEGKENAVWILKDYVDVVVHIFQPQCREFYNIEDLWADAKVTQITEDKITI